MSKGQRSAGETAPTCTHDGMQNRPVPGAAQEGPKATARAVSDESCQPTTGGGVHRRGPSHTGEPIAVPCGRGLVKPTPHGQRDRRRGKTARPRSDDPTEETDDTDPRTATGT